MKKEDFFEVLGELDDDIVKGAQTPVKKKRNWKVWGTMAACVAVVAVLSIGMLQSGFRTASNDNDVEAVTDGNFPANEERTSGGRKRAINFEGRVTKVEQGSVTIDNGKIVQITEATTVTSPDGAPAEIAEGDYIQGYAENAENSEIHAKYILITTL